MIRITIPIEVPESRQVTLQLPANVKPGPTTLEIEIAEQKERLFVEQPKGLPPRPLDPKLGMEHDAFERMLPELMKTIPGQFVAVHEEKVVAQGSNLDVVAQEISSSFRGIPVLIRQVTDQPQPIRKIPSSCYTFPPKVKVE
jgi:hypothetical protein